jgi:hypothetical protein
MEDWSSLFSLALRWEFDAVVELAKRELSKVAQGVDKIILSRKYPELEDWTVEAVRDLCMFNYAVSIESLHKLDKNDIILIVMAREAYRNNNYTMAKLETYIQEKFGLSSL